MKSRSAWFENGTEKARKLKNEKSKRLIKSAILGNADIFVGRKNYKTKKAQDLVGLVLFYTVSRGDFLFAVRKIIIRSD